MSSRPIYEFSPDQNTVIRELALKMRGVGLVQMLLGGGQAALFGILAIKMSGNNTMVPMAVQIISGLILLTIGYWVRNAAVSFLDIVETKGRDLTHLMTAIDQLRNVFSLMYMILLVWLILVIGAAAIILGTMVRGG